MAKSARTLNFLEKCSSVSQRSAWKETPETPEDSAMFEKQVAVAATKRAPGERRIWTYRFWTVLDCVPETTALLFFFESLGMGDPIKTMIYNVYCLA